MMIRLQTVKNYIVNTISSPDTISKVDRFFSSRIFIGVVGLLAALSNLFGLELVTYTLYAGAVCFICLKGTDLRGLMPIIAMGYFTPSAGNNPGRNASSVFSAGHGGIYILLLALVMAAGILWRVIQDRRRFLHKRRPLLSGMLILLGAYLLSGIGSDAYPAYLLKNIFFALLQAGSIILPYWLLSAGVNWRKLPKDYFAWIGLTAGSLLTLQITWIYLTGQVIVDGVIIREQIFTGWGMYNNIGGMLAMMIPFVFYLTLKHQWDWIGPVLGTIFLGFVFLTCSRSSISAATLVYCFCMILLFYRTRSHPHNTTAPLLVLCVLLLVTVLFHKQLLRLFGGLLETGLDPSSRDTIYKEGLELFAKAPVFGNSFYSPGFLPWDWATVDGFSSFFPPRWHNTLVQILACCGVVGLFALCLHRFQTVTLFMKRFTLENVFIACSIAVLLGSSMFDCHFFNIGPTLFYSAALAFAECCPTEAKRRNKVKSP